MNKLSTQLGILGIIIAGLFGLTIPESDEAVEDGVVVSNANRRGRMQYAADRIYKLFEFAPADGVGMTDVCPTPNWLYVSEDVVGTGWGTAGTAITTTVDYALGPDGLMSADRLEIPAIGTNGESVRFTSSSETVNPATFSAMIKGNGTSGIVDFFTGLAGYTCVSCAYNPTTWTECSVTRDSSSGSAYGYIGNESIGVVGCPSGTGAKYPHDILVWGFKLNAGTTRGVYTRTTGSATVQQPTTAKGQALTISRASQAYCNSNTDATATTGLLTGSMIKYPNHTVRVERGSNGIKAIRAEHAISNGFGFPEEFDNAAWIKDVGVTVTPNVAAGVDGYYSADRVQYAGGAAVLNRLSETDTSIAPGVWTGSVYVRGYSGSGTIYVWDDGSSVPATACAYVNTTWTKCVNPNNSPGGAAVLAIGCRSSYNGMPATCPVNDVLLWHAQGDMGPNATSPVVATTTRGADVVQFDLGASAPGANTMCVAGAVSGKPITSYEGYVGIINVASTFMGDPSGKGMWLYSPSTSGATVRCIAMDDFGVIYGISTVSGSSGNASGYCGISGNTVVGSWAGANMTPSSAISGGTWSPTRYITLAGQSLGAIDGLKYGFVVDTAANGCQ